MANLPLRNLGQVGVITDVNPYDLPPNAFSSASNVVFDDGKVQRAPVFKQMYPAIRSALSYQDVGATYDSQTGFYDSVEGSPIANTRFVGSYSDPITGDTLFVCDATGEVRSYPNGNMEFQQPGGTLVTNESSWSHAQVAGLSFLARAGMRPYVKNLKTSPSYQHLAGEWPSTDSCAVIRGYLDYVICLNVTKGTTEYPTMVKWSNPVEYSANPTLIGWDPSNPNYIAGENVLGELTSPILDGLTLGTSFVIYAKDQVWTMDYTGSSLVFNFRKLFPSGGVLNTNCVVEIEGKHFVFGEDDIYVHDGTSKVSISDGRVRRHLYNTLDRSKRSVAFVQYDSVSNLIFFCYSSKEDEALYKNTQYCNKAAIYNLKSETWSFMDLPNVVGGTSSNISLAASQYVQMDSGFELYNASYVSFQGSSPRISVMLGATSVPNGVTESRVYALDLPSLGVVNYAAHPETLSRAFAERLGIDMDTDGVPLRSYKTITAVIPQAQLQNTSGTLNWEFGGADFPNAATVWRAETTFNPVTDYKMDMKVSGRYLGYRVYTDSINNFELSGFDAEVVSVSKR